jgi:hypothetical protein
MAYIAAYRDVWFRATTSWDDVFGKPHPKGTHSNDVRLWRNTAFKVARRIAEIKENEPGTPIDGLFYDRIGRELGIGGKTKVQELYKWAKQFHKKHGLKI